MLCTADELHERDGLAGGVWREEAVERYPRAKRHEDSHESSRRRAPCHFWCTYWSDRRSGVVAQLWWCHRCTSGTPAVLTAVVQAPLWSVSCGPQTAKIHRCADCQRLPPIQEPRQHGPNTIPTRLAALTCGPESVANAARWYVGGGPVWTEDLFREV